MTRNSHIQNILKNSKKDTEWKKEAEERLQTRNESKKSGLIATQLAIYMAENGISQTDLGKMTGVSPQQISKVLKGRENLTLTTIEKIENALEIQLIEVNNLGKIDIQRLKHKCQIDIKNVHSKPNEFLDKIFTNYAELHLTKINYNRFYQLPISNDNDIFINEVTIPSKHKVIPVRRRSTKKTDSYISLSPYRMVAESQMEYSEFMIEEHE